MFVRSLAVVLIAAAAGCTDPSLSIDVAIPDPVLLAHLGGADHDVQLRAIDAEMAVQTDWPRAFGTTGIATGPATCDELELARIPADVLATATVATGTRTLAGIPRLGHKLIVAEIVENGRRVGLGCSEVDDIDEDRTVEVDVLAAARVVQLSRVLDTGADPAAGAPELSAVVPWNDDDDRDDALGGRKVEVDLYDRKGRITRTSRITTQADGVAQLDDLGDAETLPGPVQALVRVEGASEPLRIGMWHPWQRVTTTDGLPSVRPSLAPGTRPAGVAGTIEVAGQRRWIAAASTRDPSSVPHLVVVTGVAGQLLVLDLAAPGMALGAPVIVNDKLLVINGDGWHPVLPRGTPVSGITIEAPVIREAADPALEAVAVHACGSAPPTVLVRRAIGGRYAAYGGDPLGPDTAHDELLAAIGNGHVVRSLCVAAEGAPIAMLLVEADSGERRVVDYPGGGDIQIPGVSAMEAFSATDTRGRGLAAIATESGPRARSFRFATVTRADGMMGQVVIPTNAIDAPLAVASSSLSAADLDGDLESDLVALVPADGGVRIQAVLDDEIEGERLAGTSELIRLGSEAARRARVLVVDTDGDGDDEVVVVSDDGLDVFAP